MPLGRLKHVPKEFSLLLPLSRRLTETLNPKTMYPYTVKGFSAGSEGKCKTT